MVADRGGIFGVGGGQHGQQRRRVRDARPIGPAVSCTGEIGTMPRRLTKPLVGLMPTTPQVLAGETIEPSVSVPTASGARPAATPAAEPELDPDGLRSSAYGLAVCPPSVDQPLVEWVERKFAHSDRFALPMITAPAARSRSTPGRRRPGRR